MKLLLFIKTNCPACKGFRVTIGFYINQNPGAEKNFYVFNIDDPAQSSIAAEYGVTGIPTIILVREEDPVPLEVDRHVGMMPLSEFEKFVGDNLK